MKYAILPVTPRPQNGSFLQGNATGKVTILAHQGDTDCIPGHDPMSTIGHERQPTLFVADHRGGPRNRREGVSSSA